jgi:hypothetical protein
LNNDGSLCWLDNDGCCLCSWCAGVLMVPSTYGRDPCVS